MDKIKLAVFCFFYTHGKCCHHSGPFVSVWLTVLVAQRNQLKCLLKRSRKSVEVSSKLEKSLRSKVLPKPPRLITMHRAPTGRTSASSASTSCLCFRGNGARQPKRAARGRHDDAPGRSKAAALTRAPSAGDAGARSTDCGRLNCCGGGMASNSANPPATVVTMGELPAGAAVCATLPDLLYLPELVRTLLIPFV